MSTEFQGRMISDMLNMGGLAIFDPYIRENAGSLAVVTAYHETAGSIVDESNFQAARTRMGVGLRTEDHAGSADDLARVIFIAPHSFYLIADIRDEATAELAQDVLYDLRDHGILDTEDVNHRITEDLEQRLRGQAHYVIYYKIGLEDKALVTRLVDQALYDIEVAGEDVENVDEVLAIVRAAPPAMDSLGYSQAEIQAFIL